ncbi:WD40/YVTN/BNR-like repeat-containing protein [Natrinema sp. HArc-T2]|uniref:WD40/YVTN/BNR-like repeat-containing protein n=1 Tax=Natrinema sp. HArc-T2 TaxID=3242701 RepID=UPI00359CE8B0
MRLHGCYDGTLYGTRYRTVFRESSTESGSFSAVGRLPVPDSATGATGLSYRLKTTKGWKSAVTRVVGRFPSANLWPITDTDLLATADNYVFVSRDGGETWTVSLTLPESSSPMGVLPTGVCIHDDTIYLGEYPLASSTTPRVLRSTDRGATWDPIAELDGVRHVHSIQVDPYTGDLWMTTGDADSECRIGRLSDGDFKTVGSGGQTWRAVELAFTPDAIIWGVDSIYLETNPILRLDRSNLDGGRSPDILYEASNSIYYATSVSIDSVQWVVVSTAMEAGTDSTGPADQAVHSDRAKVLASSAATGFTTWHELATYEKRSMLVDYWNPRNLAPTANAYVFLAADPDRGIVTNPYNTSRNDGELVSYPPEYVADLES